jgi:septum formation protein
MARVVLASASPRRAQLLREAGLVFEIEPSGVEEELPPGIGPEPAARELARRKALAVARARAERGQDCVVLGADTIVAVSRPHSPAYFDLLGKPSDALEAAAMLERLSGTRHLVVTGLCAVRARDGWEASDCERTWVQMRPLHPREIADYVATGQWRDKAGGYGIQAGADRFVTGLSEGGYDNVVGLPVACTLRLLARAGVARA